MNVRDINAERGIIYTFYSFKGGVGRTMALANVAALMAKWGRKVLVVDWDLEAPGIERFFCVDHAASGKLRASKPGIVDLIRARTNGDPLDWRDCLLEVYPGGNSSRVSIISAGRGGDAYAGKLQGLNFAELFDKHDLGSYIEELRNEWTSEFEFVLVDSRTGVTDIGGICTVHLADVLVLVFTANDSSTQGAMDIVERARKAQERLPLDRRRLVAVPVPSRDESRTEYEKAVQWKNTFATLFGELYTDWLPSGTAAREAIDILRIPYVPYWSFGEGLPAVVEGTSDPSSLGHAYEILARLLVNQLDWHAAMEGQTLAPPPSRERRQLDYAWLDRHRKAALDGLYKAGKKGFVEVYYYSPNTSINKSQTQLRDAATQAKARTSSWPLGQVFQPHYVVANQDRFELFPISGGIAARGFFHGLFGYWTIAPTGDFYTLMSLEEDKRRELEISIQARVFDVTGAMLHCENLYRALGVEPHAQIDLSVGYRGLRGRNLVDALSYSPKLMGANRHEDEARAEVTFRLNTFQTEVTGLVKQLCEPLFVLFDFATLPDETYEKLVRGFIAGKTS